MSEHSVAETEPPVGFDTFGTDEESMEEWTAKGRGWALEEMREAEQEWRGKGMAVTWIDQEPTFMPATSLYIFLGYPEKPCRRIARLTLAGGGQIRLREDFVRYHFRDGTPYVGRAGPPKLAIVAHTAAGVTRLAALVHEGCSEIMQANAVIMAPRDQAIADRVAATLRAINATAENFYALLDGASGCAICNRPLRDEISKLCAVGPDCARQNHIPHSLAAAGKRLELRRTLLAKIEAPA